jgi:flavin-dependent dehydrogenase
MRLITIAGGGLAGLSLGIALRRRDVPVRVIEATDYPRHRVCGEFISGIHSEEIIALGIDDLFTLAPRHRETAWFDGEQPMLRQTLPEAAYGLSRHFLDDALADRFRTLGGELRTGERHQGDAEGVVWACGRKKSVSPWMGLKAHFTNLPLSADLEVHLHNCGYVGLTRVEQDRVNVAGLFHRRAPVNAARDSNALVTAIRDTGFTHLAERLDAASLDSASLKGVNQFSLGWQAQRAGRVCIGDAAAMIPPFTGNGMTMALQSALAAVEPLCEWSAGHSEWSTTAQIIATTQRQRFARRLLWAQGLQSVLMRSTGRKLAAFLIKRGCLRFETLYRHVR